MTDALATYRLRTVLLASATLLFLVCAGLAFLAGPLWAGGGPIVVVDSSAEVSAPGAVNLSLTAESDSDIVQVRVYYRPLNARAWGYAYPAFEPDTTISTRQSLPAGSDSYLAPGADVEYYYEIRDSQGNVLKTEPSRIEYLDRRFDWQRSRIGPLTLLYHGLPESRVDALAPELEADLARITGLLDLETPRAIKGVVYLRESDAQDAFPRQSQATSDQAVFAGFALAEQGVFVGQGLDRRIIVHESAHLLVAQALESRIQDLPAWLGEGLASYFEPGRSVADGRVLYGRSLPLSSMNTVSGRPAAIRTFYQKARSVVTYLIDEHGEAKFRSFMAELRADKTIDESLETVYGFDVDGLDLHWAGLAATPSQERPDRPQSPETVPAPPGPGPAGGPSPFAFADSWIIIGAALAVIVAVSVRAIYRWLRPAPQADLETNPWDNYP